MKSEWIDIIKEFPPIGQGVLIALNTGVITIGYRKLKAGGRSHDWQIFGDLEFLGLHQHDFVTHWMPLPEAPNFEMGNRTEEMYTLPKHHWQK